MSLQPLLIPGIAAPVVAFIVVTAHNILFEQKNPARLWLVVELNW